MSRIAIIAALAATFVIANQATAKPPDLPLDLSVRCEDPESFPCPDACLLGGCVGWAVQVLQGESAAVEAEQLTVMPKVARRTKTARPASRKERDERDIEELHYRSHQLRLQSEAARPEDSDRQQMARRLFVIAETCRRNGDHEMAYNCYCEVELLIPNSPLGERARKSMEECRRQLGGVEEAEPQEADADTLPGDKLPMWKRHSLRRRALR